MIFARLDVDITDHPRAIMAGVAAFGLWCWGLAYCRKHETDGLLPADSILAAMGGREGNVELAHRLLEAGLWEQFAQDTRSCFRMVNYAKKNETKAQIEKRIKQARARKSKFDKSKKVVPLLTSGTRYDSVPADSGSGSVKSLPEGECEGGAQERYAMAYARGQSEATKSPFTTPAEPFQLGALNRSIQSHGKGLRGDELLIWIQRASRAYRLANPDPRFEGGYKPSRFEAWLNGGGMKVERPHTMSPRVVPKVEDDTEAIPCPPDLLAGLLGGVGRKL